MILSTLILFSLQAGSLDTALEQAAALAAKNNFSGAVQLLKEAGVENSTDAAAWTIYGELSAKYTENEIASGRVSGLEAYDVWNDVAWIYEQASSLQGAQVTVWVNWSEALLNANDITHSLHTIENGLEHFDHSPTLRLQKGRVYMASARASTEVGDKKIAAKNYLAAEEAYQLAAKASPHTAAPLLRLGELYWTLYFNGGGKDQTLHDRAVQHFVDAATQQPSGVDSGMISSWLGAESIPVLDVLIEKQADVVLHYWYRGSAFYALGPTNWPQLRDDFLKVLDLNPQFTNAYYFLADGAMQRGTQLSNAGEQAKAEKAFSASAKFWALYLKDFGTNYRATVMQNKDGGKNTANIMNWLAGKTDLQNGTILLQWAVETVPSFADAWNNLALFYRDAGNAEQARDAYARALELRPEDPQIMNDYAVIYHYYLHSEDDLARDLYQNAIKSAQEMLDTGKVADGDENRIRTALQDANNNLKKLNAGNRTNR